MSQDYSFIIGFDSIDLSLLPKKSRTPGTESFRIALTRLIEEEYKDFGGRLQILVNEENKTIQVKWVADSSEKSLSDRVLVNEENKTIQVKWVADSSEKSLSDRALEYLKRGEYKKAIPLLEFLKRVEPDNLQHFYNHDMVLSDSGDFENAEKELLKALQLDQGFVNAKVALGVVYLRNGDTQDAARVLEEAVRQEPENPWAQRNLGACLLKSGEPDQAESHFRKSLESLPNDQQALFGLAQALDDTGKSQEADEIYIRVINLGARTPVGEAAKVARTKLAQKSFRKAGVGAERMDAVMYCMGALDRFENMTLDKVQAIGFEIALLGMKGLDTNDSTQKYTLKSLPGKFSGLHLVCLMYVAFKAFAPEQDVGFDLSREHTIARQMHAQKKDKQQG